jgi:hypothetical protein
LHRWQGALSIQRSQAFRCFHSAIIRLVGIGSGADLLRSRSSADCSADYRCWCFAFDLPSVGAAPDRIRAQLIQVKPFIKTVGESDEESLASQKVAYLANSPAANLPSHLTSFS